MLLGRAVRRLVPSTLVEWFVVGGISACLAALLTPAVTSNCGRRAMASCEMNLHSIGQALRAYHDTYGSFPAAYVADEQGTPMHSWRVLLLPFLDEQALYDEYRFDEPWNGSHNSRLEGRIPSVYQSRFEPIVAGERDGLTTSVAALIGPATAWPGADALRLDDISDELSETLLVVEVARSGIHWMEPRDLDIAHMAETVNSERGLGVSSRHERGAHALFADNSVRLLKNELPPATLRALLTRNGGERPTNGF